MSLQPNGLILWPDRYDPMTGGSPWSTASTYDLKTAQPRLAGIMQVPASGDISGLTILLESITTAQDLSVSLQSITSNAPSGAGYKGSAAGTIAAGSLVAKQLMDVALGTQATAAVAGDTVAVVVGYASTVGTVRVGGTAGNYAGAQAYDGSAWAPIAQGRIAAGLKYADGTYRFPFNFGNDAVGTFFANNTNPNEIGMKLVVPFKCRVVGIAATFSGQDPATIVSANLYSGTTLLAGGYHLGHAYASATFATTLRKIYFPAPVTLSPGTYYVGIGCGEGTYLSVTAFPFAGQVSAANLTAGSCYVQRVGLTWSGNTATTNANAWAETATKSAPVSLMIDQLGDEAGGGGSARPARYRGLGF